MFALMGSAAIAQTNDLETRVADLESSVKKMNQLKLSGYIQAQWKWDQSKIDAGSQNDFSIRRGRLKSTYSNQFGEAVLQIDITESGVGIKDAYLRFQDPRVNWVGLKAGVFDRPFGYEISYSSSRRESPERSKVFLTLFPKERDLGAALEFKGPKNTALRNFSLSAGLFTGNGGAAKETDSKKDFIGHLGFNKDFGGVVLGLGTSLYEGGVRLAAGQNAYKMENGRFVQDTKLSGTNDYAKREYFGFDGQLAIKSSAGVTTLRGEYLWGTQPGLAAKSDSPTGAVTDDIYSRKFSGFYAYLVQDFGKHTLVAKFDRYDPNTKVSKDECVTAGDVAYNTFGFGYLYQPNSNIRVMAYYDIVNNEKVKNNSSLAKFEKDLRDNTFTLRLQYKF